MKPGDSVGPYVILEPIGSGGMGQVFRARDTRLGRDVALKQLSDPTLTADVVRRRILHEAGAAAALSHPNIATVFDVLDTPEGPALVMEYVVGESVADHVARGALPAARALDIAIQTAGGLVEAHAHGIIHRDLKPANIQVTPDGKVKILDFGIARLTSNDTDPGSATTVSSETAARVVGTPGYMAPEQLRGGQADARTDIYALGVLLYEMLTGRRPFRGTDPISSAMAVMQGGAPAVAEIVPDTPPGLSALVERAMATDPDRRFQSAGELAGALERERRGLADGSPAGASQTARALRIPAGVALALVAVLMLAGVGWQWLGRGREAVVSAHGSAFAVLPFRSAAGESTDPVAAGLTDAVANRLSSLQSLRLLSLDESREAARGARDAASAARALGASFVVEGDLRQSGQTLDVDVSLVSADGRRRPAGRFTGELAQVFDLHQRIAQGVIATLAAADALPAPAAPNPAPTASQEAYADYAQARLFLERPDVPQNLDHAVRLFQSAIAKDPRFALAFAGLGQAYWAQYRQTADPAWTTKATTAILDALRIDPNQPEVRISLAVMYQGLGRLDAAEEELRRVLAMQPWNDDAHRLYAGVYIDRGQWDPAVEQLRRAIELRPNYWRNHSELGFAHYRAGRHDEAVAAYERVVELQPDSALGFHMLGSVHQSAGRLQEALVNYVKANGIRPRAGTYSNIGTIHFWSGEYAPAVDAYERAINLAPNTPELLANLGDTWQKLGRRERARASYQGAVDEIRKQLAVNEHDAINLSLLALYLAKLDDSAAADAAAAKALALNPDDGQVLYTVAMADALAGRSADACARLERAVALGTSAEMVRRADEFRSLEGCDAYDRISAR